MKEAMFYEKIGDHRVQCHLCAHRCKIADGKRGICGVRENRDGTLYTLTYDKVVSQHIDPIEKKPLFNFYPGSRSYSIATVGCNFRCLHCQNYEISQMPRDDGMIMGEKIDPEDIVEAAKDYECKSISYTYTEPTIFYELAYDTARLATEEGIKNVFVTNGYITEEALTAIQPYLHAANIDLKSFSEEHYKRVCGAKMQPVLEAIKAYKKLGIWIEITTLIIPNYNDSEDELRRIADFIGEVGVDIPWHVTQFYPTYKLLDQPRTPVSILRKARQIGLEAGLRYVYEGNVPGEGGENTYCYNCKELLIQRFGYQILKYLLKDSRCPYCGVMIDGVGL